MAFVKLVVFGFLALSVIYLSISVYSRSVRREKLEKQWDAENPGGAKAERDAYVEAGMIKYERGFRRKLIVLVFIIPPVFVAVILYLTNTN